MDSQGGGRVDASVLPEWVPSTRPAGLSFRLQFVFYFPRGNFSPPVTPVSHWARQLVLSLRKEYSVMDAITGALTPALLLSDRDHLDASASSM